MTARLVLLAPLAACILLVAGGGVATSANPPTTQCKNIKGCVTVTGPWVAVPADGSQATFLLECTKRQGIIAGVDALASSTSVVVSWEANPGTPIRAGTSTGPYLLFHATATDGKAGVFQPFIGCIPPPKVSPRSTMSAKVTKPGKPLDLWQSKVTLKPGKTVIGTRVCGKKGEHLVAGWQAVAFDTLNQAPNPDLAALAHVALTVGDARVVATVRTDHGMPPTAYPEIQVGAVCAT
jgi:hypothetical protein